MNAMAPIYARLVQRGLKQLSDVPESVRAEVEALLSESENERA